MIKSHLEALCWCAVSDYYGRPVQNSIDGMGRTARYKRLLKTVESEEEDGYLKISYEGKPYRIKLEWPIPSCDDEKQSNIIAFPKPVTTSMRQYDDFDADELLTIQLVKDAEKIEGDDHITDNGEPVYTLTWDGDGYHNGSVSILKLGELYYCNLHEISGELTGPFYTLKQALLNSELMIVTEATESISCTEMSAREIAELLEDDGMRDMNYQFSINNEYWKWDARGLRSLN